MPNHITITAGSVTLEAELNDGPTAQAILEALPITAAWERPVANLVGVPLSFTNMSDSMLKPEAINTDLEAHLRSADYYIPIFGHGTADGASFFDLRGTLIDPMAASDSAAGLFETINQTFGAAIGEIGNEDSVPTLTAQWLEFVLIAPGGKEQVFRRSTIDRIGAGARSRQQPGRLSPTSTDDVRALHQRHTFMVSTGRIPRGFVIDAAVENRRRRADRFADLAGGEDLPVGAGLEHVDPAFEGRNVDPAVGRHRRGLYLGRAR